MNDADQTEEQQHALARTGMVSPMGTLIDELKTKVDPDTAAIFRRKVHEIGSDTSAALRDWVYLVAHGKTYSDLILEASKAKRDALFGTGPFQALKVMGEVKS